jgi:hypothetical protein
MAAQIVGENIIVIPQHGNDFEVPDTDITNYTMNHYDVWSAPYSLVMNV